MQDAEPAPTGLPQDLWQKFGYSQYSARYGNIYTSRQLLQLLREVFERAVSPDPVWEKDGRFYDSMRPAAEPDGLASAELVLEHRIQHLQKIKELIINTDVFIFTLGLTECWQYKGTGWVFPTAPGTIAGSYDAQKYEFLNLSYDQVRDDTRAAREIIKEHSQSTNLRFLFTVSPVPLTATYSSDHVLVASSYSKSVLRCVAGDLVSQSANAAYFPSYEMVVSNWSRGAFFDNNLRTVNRAGVDIIMSTFISHHQLDVNQSSPMSNTKIVGEFVTEEEVACEEALLDVFAKN